MNKKVYNGVEIEVCLFPRVDALVASGITDPTPGDDETIIA